MAKKKKSGGIHIKGNRIEIHGDVVGRDKITNYLIQGINGLSTDYADRIKNFLVEYLGTPEKPVPFGGRQAELAALDAWLANPTAPPYTLIAAEAGRGKSALLARWMKSVLERDLAHVVFIPISIRFNTALESVTFTALAASLGQIYSETVKFADMSAQQWRSVCLSYLNRPPPDGKPLLVILDGLDEAADWRAGPDVFPLDPPRGVRTVVSARYLGGDVDEQGWLRRLNWEAQGRARGLPLPSLTREGVSDVLAAMGHPLDKLATQVDVIGELFRLSEGDPLLVRLYVEALLPYGDRAAILRPEDLPSIKEGLAGYFERWWEDQRHQWKLQGRGPLAQGVDALNFFNVCASALGPLSTDDVAEIAGGNLTSGLKLKAVTEDVARFVIGDGRTRGYVFSHPRLSQFFREQMTTPERAAWDVRFLEYGRRTLEALNTRRLSANKASAYAVQYYGAHLERAEEVQGADLYALVSEGWLRAWEALEGTYTGFLNDTERVWRRAEAEHEIVMQIKCALCSVSVIALSANIPPELLALAMQHNMMTPLQALVIARQKPKEIQRSKALAELAPYLPEHLKPNALAAALVIENEKNRAKVLSALAPRLPENLIAEVLTATRAIKDAGHRVETLTALIPHLPKHQKVEVLQDALAAMRTIGDKWKRTILLSTLAPYLPNRLMAYALTDACGIGDKWKRAIALAALAPHLPAGLMTDALAAARAINIESKWARAKALAAVAPRLTEPQRAEALQDALTATQAIENKGALTKVLVRLAPHLPEPQRTEALQDALKATYAIRDVQARAKALTTLAPYLLEHQKAKALQDAFAAASAIGIKYKWARVKALADLAPHLPETQRAEALQDALATARAIELKASRSLALAALAPHLPEAQRAEALQDAFAATRSIGDRQAQVKALTALAPHLPKSLMADVLTATHMIEDAGHRAKALATVASYLPEAQRAEALQDAFTAACTIGNIQVRTEVSAALSPYLPEAQKAKVLQDVLTAMRTTRSYWNQAWNQAKTLAKLAPHLPSGLMSDALIAVCTLESDWSRANALVILAPYLPKHLIAEAFAAARAIKGTEQQAEAFVRLAPNLPEAQRAEALQDTLTAIRTIENAGLRAIKFVRLAPNLPESQRAEVLQDAFATARTIENSEQRVEAFAGLALHLPEPQKAEALRDAFATAHAIEDIGHRAEVFAALAPHLPEPQKDEALQDTLTAAHAIEDIGHRAEVFAALAPHLPEPQKAKVLQDAFTAARTIEDAEQRVEALARLAPDLPEARRTEAMQGALTSACTIESGYKRPGVYAPVALSSYLIKKSPIQQGLLQGKTISMGKIQIKYQGTQSDWIATLASHLHKFQGSEALQDPFNATNTIMHIWDQEEALVTLTPHLSEPQRAKVLQDALAVAGAIEIEHEGTQAHVLVALVPDLVRWAKVQPVPAFRAWKATLRELSVQPRQSFLDYFRALIPFTFALVRDEDRTQTAADIFESIQEVGRWWP